MPNFLIFYDHQSLSESKNPCQITKVSKMWPEPATSNPNQGVGADMGQQTQTDIQFKLYTGRGHTILTIFNILNNFLNNL